MQWQSSLLMVCPSCFRLFFMMFMVMFSLDSIGVHGCCSLGLCWCLWSCFLWHC
jgi:hypothetical protein